MGATHKWEAIRKWVIIHITVCIQDSAPTSNFSTLNTTNTTYRSRWVVFAFFEMYTKLEKAIYHFPTEDSLLKEWEGCSPVSRWEMNVGRS